MRVDRRRFMGFAIAALAMIGLRPSTSFGAADPSEDRWNHLSPEEQERVRANWQRLQQMSPDERARVQEAYEAFQKMTPESREQLRHRVREFRELPEVKREEMRHRYETDELMKEIHPVRKVNPKRKRKRH